MTNEQALAKITEVSSTLTKIGGETSSLVRKVDDLTKALADAQAAGGAITPELEAAINAVSAQANAVDALVPDAAQSEAPATEPAPEPTA